MLTEILFSWIRNVRWGAFHASSVSRNVFTAETDGITENRRIPILGLTDDGMA